MLSRHNYTKEEKLAILHQVESGCTIQSVCDQYNLSKSTFRRWKNKVQAGQEDELEPRFHQRNYSSTLKEQAVQAWIGGQGSQETICLIYGIRSTRQLRHWILQYTEGKALKSTSGGPRPMSGRPTTQEEHLEIVGYCETHGRNYRQTAALYQISYSQIYTWMNKYDNGGEQALCDRRGKAKEETRLIESDQLRIEMRKLQQKNRDLEAENALLKNWRNSREKASDTTNPEPSSHLFTPPGSYSPVERRPHSLVSVQSSPTLPSKPLPIPPETPHRLQRRLSCQQ